MTFIERYNQEETWHGKVLVMEIFHLAMISRETGWTMAKTAQNFGCSIGLVSENLKLAIAIHTFPDIEKIPLRYTALTLVKYRSKLTYGSTKQ